MLARCLEKCAGDGDEGEAVGGDRWDGDVVVVKEGARGQRRAWGCLSGGMSDGGFGLCRVGDFQRGRCRRDGRAVGIDVAANGTPGSRVEAEAPSLTSFAQRTTCGGDMGKRSDDGNKDSP